MTFESTPEPRKIFLGFLITTLMEIESCLYNSPHKTSAASMMLGLIDSLNKEAKDALKNQYATLVKLREQGPKRNEMEKLYSEITTYLHATILKELSAKPRFLETGKSLGSREQPARTE